MVALDRGRRGVGPWREARPDRARRRVGRRVARIALAVAAVVLFGGWSVYGDQAWRLVTHLKGSPSSTVAYEPLLQPPLLHLAALGDVGEPGSRLSATARGVAAIAAHDPFDAVLLLGDNVYPNGDPARLDEVVFDPLAPVLADGSRLLAILGNHDVADDHADAQLAALGMPARWWAETWGGDLLVVGLDSTTPHDPAQRRFLERVLSRSTATWKIVALHHPPYSAGYQGSSSEARDIFSPTFARHGVQLVLSGHDHDYQRSEPIDGVVYVVSGAAAMTRRTGEDDFTAVSFSWHHFVDIHVFADRLVLRAVNQDLRVADEVTIPSVRSYGPD